MPQNGIAPTISEFTVDSKGVLGSSCLGEVFFVASSGNVTDEVIREYIETQDMPKPGDDFR